MAFGLSAITTGISAGALLTLATLLVILGWRGKDRTAKWILTFSAVAALLLALSQALATLAIQVPVFRLLAVLAGSASILSLLAKLPGWLQVRAGSETVALVKEKEQAVGKLLETEAHLEHLVEGVREYAIFKLDAQGRIASWNLGAEQVKGWRAEEVLGQPHSVFYPEDDVQAGKPYQDLEEARVKGSVHGEVRRIHKDGNSFMASVVLTALHDASGEVTGFTNVTHDITERLEAESRQQSLARDLEAQVTFRTAELRESEARLQGFIRHASAAIAFKGLDGRLLLVNRRAEALIGACQAATPGEHLLEAFPPDIAALAREHDECVITSRQETLTEEAISLPDGSLRNLLVQKFPLLDAIGHCWGIGVIATDITERKQTEQAHLQHQKLESIGLLAGGIAHDFNNLLAAMSGNLELAGLELSPEAAAAPYIRTTETLISRASTLVAQILAYAGKGKFQMQVLDLNHQVVEITRLLRASLSRNATLRWEPAPNLPSLAGDPAQVQQVIMNLVLNASEAVASRGGVITLRTGLETLDREGIDRHFPDQALRPGPHVSLEVADNGQGMAPQVKERIFEPFFTTKFTGRGLGLAAVQGILRSHSGGIRVASKEGEGTTFKVFFPVATEVKRVETPEPPACQVRFADYRGSGTVLVVDDEEALRAMAGSALCRLGFKVLEAQDGQEAIEVFETNREQICLILMDLTMPRMDGEEAFRALRRAGARVPIILSSGFSPEEALQRFTGKGLAGFLQKPYRFQTLVDTVREALGEHCGEGEPRRYPSPKPVLWCPEFVTGHPVIDAQHQGLVEGFNRLVATTLDANGEKSAEAAALHTLIGATLAHFGIEESLMAAADYPAAPNHKDVHTHLTNQVQGLASEFQRGLVNLSPPTLHFLEGWLLCHVQYEDRDLAHFLIAKGL
jgi:hemerythrin-like metal-binding protein/PAS domain S-box-containing protein